MSVYAAPNPVLPGTADVGVIRFNGKYYLMGVHTDGAFYVSPDLVRWDGPHHAFSMNNDWATGDAGKDREIHACDIVLHNGVFNLYWSVNYRQLRNIGRAVSDAILGPYREPVRDAPFDGRIDPQLFVDDDGACYFYTVKFRLGNIIYGQPMQNPATLTGEPMRLLSAVPNTWELRDYPVNEAQWVMRYRDRYYMLYNANHTGLEYGNYGIGCAVADDPLGFSNDTKYPFFILRDNWDRIHENARVVSPLSRDEGVLWRYTAAAPGPAWTQPDYDDSAWYEGQASFGNNEIFMLGGTIRTQWDSAGIWLRREFTLPDPVPAGDWRVFINHDADAEVFINGASACALTGFSGGYRLQPLSEEAVRALRPGANLLAAHCAHDDLGAQYIDAGLYLFEPGKAEPEILNCGQPNVVRGPNGFEWWMVYFAVYDGDPRRGQAIDRVHFFDRELVMTPPTSATTPGTLPPPAAPTFGDLFEGDALSDAWTPWTGDWRVEDGALAQTMKNGLHRISLDVAPRDHYLFETGLRFTGDTDGQIGVIAWERGPAQALYIGLDRNANTWFWAHRNEFVIRTEVFNMPDNFNWDGWHALRLIKNGPEFAVYIDNIPAPGDHRIHIAHAGPGRCGLVTRDSAAVYGGVVFTAGWDEYDGHIRDWGDAACGTTETGVWGAGLTGLLAEPQEDAARSFKGDLLSPFEWSVQVLPEAPEPDARFGIYALYCDEANYLRVALNADMTEVIVDGKRDGAAREPQILPVVLRTRRLLPLSHGGINLRTLRMDGAIVLYVDGREIVALADDWPAAQVGLFTDNVLCRFNGITLFDRGNGHAH